METGLRPGDRLDTGTVYRLTADEVHSRYDIISLLQKNRAVIFGGPAPFSKLDTRQAKEYAELSGEISKYVDYIYGIYCQDAFVMNQFDKHISGFYPNHSIAFYGDGDAFFIRNYRLTQDFTHQGLSVRCGRYAFVVNDCVLEHVVLDDYKQIGDSSAENILNWLKSN